MHENTHFFSLKPESSCFAKSNRKLLSCVVDNECYYTILLLQKGKRALSISQAEIVEDWISHLLHTHMPHAHFLIQSIHTQGPGSLLPKPRRGFTALVDAFPNDCSSKCWFPLLWLCSLAALPQQSSCSPLAKLRDNFIFLHSRRKQSQWQNFIKWTKPQIDSHEFFCKTKCLINSRPLLWSTLNSAN